MVYVPNLINTLTNLWKKLDVDTLYAAKSNQLTLLKWWLRSSSWAQPDPTTPYRCDRSASRRWHPSRQHSSETHLSAPGKLRPKLTGHTCVPYGENKTFIASTRQHNKQSVVWKQLYSLFLEQIQPDAGVIISGDVDLGFHVEVAVRPGGHDQWRSCPTVEDTFVEQSEE